VNTPDLIIKVLYRKSEVRKAIYSDSLRKPLFWATAVIPAAVISFDLPTSPAKWTSAIGVACGILLLVPLLRARSILKSEALSSPITFNFSETGVRAEYVNGSNAAGWSLVTGARENSHFLFVNMQRGSFHLIPKAQITGEQATSLRAILRSHIQKNNLPYRLGLIPNNYGIRRLVGPG